MDAVLIVVRPFGGYRVGDVIDDPGHMRDALKGEHAKDVVRIGTPTQSVRRQGEI
jgi:hypothetical protein